MHSYSCKEIKIISGLDSKESITDFVITRAVESEVRTPVRDLADRLLIQNKWASSTNPGERFAIQSIETLGYDDQFETMLCKHLDRSEHFNKIRQKNRPLSTPEKESLVLLIKQTRAGITSRMPIKNKALDLLIPIGKAFFSLKSSCIVAVSFFVSLLLEFIGHNNIQQLRPLLYRGERKLTQDLKAVLEEGSYRKSKSGKDARDRINQFLNHNLEEHLPQFNS